MNRCTGRRSTTSTSCSFARGPISSLVKLLKRGEELRFTLGVRGAENKHRTNQQNAEDLLVDLSDVAPRPPTGYPVNRRADCHSGPDPESTLGALWIPATPCGNDVGGRFAGGTELPIRPTVIPGSGAPGTRNLGLASAGFPLTPCGNDIGGTIRWVERNTFVSLSFRARDPESRVGALWIPANTMRE